VRTGSSVLAFSQHSPQQGCSLKLVVDLDFPEPYFREGAVLADPCHGAMFAVDGTHLGGPSPRDLDQYRVDVSAGRITVDTTSLLAAP
jgi:Rieske Fe-S protein